MKLILSKGLVICFCAVLFISCSKKPGSAIRDFYSTNDWSEKIKSVYDNEGLEAGMLKKYFIDFIDVKIETITPKHVQNKRNFYEVGFRIKDANGVEKIERKEFITYNDGKSELIDFKSMIVYNSTSLMEINKLTNDLNVNGLRVGIKYLRNNHEASESFLIYDYSGSIEYRIYCDRVDKYLCDGELHFVKLNGEIGPEGGHLGSMSYKIKITDYFE